MSLLKSHGYLTEGVQISDDTLTFQWFNGIQQHVGISIKQHMHLLFSKIYEHVSGINEKVEGVQKVVNAVPKLK